MKTGILIFSLVALTNASAQMIIGFDTTRGGSYNLQSQTAVQTAISNALPSATYSFSGTLDSGILGGASGVVIMSPHDNAYPITPLTTTEQNALAAFVAGGGFAIIVTDSDYTPTMFDATNDSFLAPFGFSANGQYTAPITITNPSGNPISNGPFGLVSSLSGIAAGSYLSAPTAFQPLGTNVEGFVAAGYFAKGAINAGSGAVLFVADSNVYNSLGSTPNNYKLLSNFVAFAAIPEPSTLALLLTGVGTMVFAATKRYVKQKNPVA